MLHKSLLAKTYGTSDDLILVFDTSLGDGSNDIAVALGVSTLVDVSINWGDGSSHAVTTNLANHNYQVGGIYTVRISGTLEAFGGQSNLSRYLKMTKCVSFGNLGITSLAYCFNSCENLTVAPTELPSTVTNLQGMFSDAKIFNGYIGNWDTSNVTNISYMFQNCYVFNQNIGSWDVSNVTSLINMFHLAMEFNQDIGSWDVSNVTSMERTFYYAKKFNQDISSWNVSNVTNMSSMFRSAGVFNQDIGSWGVSGVTNMSYMFKSAALFNQDIGNWDVSNVTNMYAVFFFTQSFNQDISSWDVSSAINMTSMFNNATQFNQDISSWDVSNVPNMIYMFYSASSFNQDLSGWCVPTILTEPYNFKTDSALAVSNTPVWGTCPVAVVPPDGIPLGLTTPLLTISGQVDAWTVHTIDVSAYAGRTVRVVFEYTSGSTYTGDMQLDSINVDGADALSSLESTTKYMQASSAQEASYAAVAWGVLITGTIRGAWNRDSGGTPSSGTGRVDANDGSYYVYAETSGSGIGYPSKKFWLRTPSKILSSLPTLSFAEARLGATIGTLNVYLDIIS